MTFLEPIKELNHRRNNLKPEETGACMEREYQSTVKPGMRATCSASVPEDEQTFLINFNLINEWGLAIWVGPDTKCHMITTGLMVLSFSLSLSVCLQDCGWSFPMLRCLVSGCGVWQKSVIFQNPQLALAYLLSLQRTFAFPYKSKLRNALLHSRSACLQI